jgi:aryl carrier-like protein
MSIVAGLCRMQPLAPVAEAMLKEEAVLKEKDDLVLNQRVAVKAMQLAAKWQAEGKALVIWSQDQLQAEKDAEKAAE